VKIEPSSDIIMAVDGEQDRAYVTGIVEFGTFCKAIKAHPLDVFYAWSPSESERDEWRKRDFHTRVIEDYSSECLLIMWTVMGTHLGADIRRRLWDVGLCMCPDTDLFVDVTGKSHGIAVVRDSVAKKLNDDCPGSFTPFHAN
jgi:hypothetical protein